MSEILAQITAPHFCAGIVLREDVVIDAAPIVHYMAEQSWTRQSVRDYCAKKRWSIKIVDQIAIVGAHEACTPTGIPE
jgi:hypothetical protein